MDEDARERRATVGEPAAGIRPWTGAAALAVGCGAAPLLVALRPWPAWAALAAVVAVALVGVPVALAELRTARLDVEQSRHPARSRLGLDLHAATLLSTVLAGLAVVQAAWAATALVRLATDGPAGTTPGGIEDWMGVRQGFLGVAGWQGSRLLLAAAGLVTLVAAAVLAGRAAARWIVALLAAGLVGLLACGARMRATSPGAAPAWWDTDRLLPPLDPGALPWLAAALIVALLACGSAAGAAPATTLRLGRGAAARGRGRVLLPLAATLAGVVALAPLASPGAAAPMLAPAPFGRQAALLLVEPPIPLGGAGWQVARYSSLLATSLLAVLVASQPVMLALGQVIGVGARGAAAVCALLLLVVAAPCLVLPGLREGVLLFAGLGLVVYPVRVLLADWPERPRERLARCVALAALLAAIALVPWAIDASGLGGWPDAALARNGTLGLGLPLVLLVFWSPLFALAAWRGRRAATPPAPASPAARRTRA